MTKKGNKKTEAIRTDETVVINEKESQEAVENGGSEDILESTETLVNEGGPEAGQNDRIALLEDEVSALKIELEQSKDALLRRTAEFENAKKRMMRENFRLLDDAKIEALKQFLPVNDDLQRTLLAAQDQDIPASFLEGVNMIAEKFSGLLVSNGVEQINATNVPFDVNLHDALMKMPSPEPSIASNTVLQILEPGYKIGDKIIRHAKVIVSE